MKKSLFPILALLILHACQEPDLLPKDELSGDYIYASVESVNATKTSMDQNNNVLWSEGDQLVAFMKTTLPSRFQVMDESVGKTTGSFRELEDEGDGNDRVSGNELDHNIVLYPFSSETSCMKSDNSTDVKSYKLNVVLPETQFYAEDSFAEGAFPMAAISSSNSFTFKNICGGIKLQFLGVDKIRSIRLEGVDKEKISGQSSVVCYVGGESPVITMDADANDYVTLDCGEGVQLNESTPTTFIIAVPPVTFASGMKITVTDSDGLSKTLTNSSSNTIKRSYLLTFPVITYDQNGVLELPQDALTSYEVPAEGGTVEIPVITNQDYQVEISEEGKDWISVAETKALREERIKLNVLENTTIQERSAEVLIASSSGIISQAIVISQKEGSMPAVDLSEEGTANSYIVSASGAYKFSTVKGNSSESVGAVASAEVLWETFGTDVTPNVGDLVKNAVYSDGYITFQTAETFTEGNAVIAAKDASGTILWSWHIWLTDEPEGQVYYNNAGTMMDRNLGATSATPGDVGALGLLYQWGRKDPFLGSLSISSRSDAKSTITWSLSAASNSNNGSIAYATAHPTTFILNTHNRSNHDWYYTGSNLTDNTRWTESSSEKSIYDPCPSGWRVPDNDVWFDALGSSDSHYKIEYDSTNKGMNFSGKFGSASTIWYPASGYRLDGSGSLENVRLSPSGLYWSASPCGNQAYNLYFNDYGEVNPGKYSYRAYGAAVRCVQEESVPSTPDPESVDLSEEGTANSYIVSASGAYKFSTVKGNSSEPVGTVASAEVLWETFGTDVTPNVGDLVKNAAYSDGYITFQTADTFKEGNAVIAAKDASGTILWSWHIWLTDEPEGQVYYNNAGTMMDRNLGATSATPGDVGALGLLYQWGRKDPFLGSSSISSNTLAMSTITWPSAVKSNASNGTIEYATTHPTTFITYNNNSNYDWYYTGSSSTDNTRWTESDKSKSIYDPCPSGWRVPDGGENGIWSIALGSSLSFIDQLLYDSTKEGINFSNKFGLNQEIWYPASGSRYNYNGELKGVGSGGYSWSASPKSYNAYQLFFLGDGYINSSYNLDRASGFSVRCVREGTTPSTPSTPYAVNLSEDGTANSYIVSQKGSYKFSTVKGNSSESVGAVASAEVLWETFGTDVTPNVGDLVKNAAYSDGYITFQTAETFNEGNAVIAAKDASGTILWSWHIWLTDQPKEHVYRNNAGTMMDRNLGATSATPGDVEALGLLYQWGRKDPFLGSSSISQSVRATSTLEWPQSISSGNIQLSIENPTTFICQSSGDEDWYVTSPRNDDRWMTSKTIYDPCPYGWRVPDGSVNGIWDLAGFDDLPFDTQNKGISFEIESPATTWYPATGAISNDSGSLYNTAAMAFYWSATPTVNKYANVLSLILDGTVIPWYYDVRATGNPVRCCKEESKQEESGDSNESEYGNYLDMSLAEDISVDGTANSYIISKSGTYKIKAVKGNSQELVGVSSNVDPVGEIYYADVMWESFGTAQEIKKCDLITAIYYEDSYVAFKTVEEFQEGNAVIAVRDKDGSILWSWHIWMTDEPKGQVYYNDAGTMMDRNLGATSAKPGDVEAQGLLYQWGRKDPFLGASSIDGFESALSTIEWPESVNTDSNSGTIAYATANPTTYISGNIEWMASPDENRWSETKTIYDPCPAGWHVPLGGMYGLIAEAVGDPSYFEYAFDDINKGMNFSGKFGADDIIWYPAFNGRSYNSGDFASKYYSNRYYWFCNSSNSDEAFCMSLSSRGNVYPYNSQGTANALPVRCCKE